MGKLAFRILLTLLAAAPASAGTLTGRVVLIQDGKPRGDASNVVVWIEGLPRPAGDARAQMKSSSKRFEPHILAVPKNATVEFPNADPIYHNVFSVSGANRFDLGLYRSGASKSKRFEEPGLVRVYCNIHPQMVGFVQVVDSDFAAVTGPDGAFRFDGVPAGNWEVKVWHEEGGENRAAVSVRPGAETSVALRLDASEYRLQAHKNKYGKEYPPQPPADDERY